MTRQSDSQNQKKSAAHVSASTIHSTRPVALLIPVLIATVIGQLMLMFRCPPSELAQRMNLDSFGTMAMSSGFWILLATLLVMIWKMVLVARYRPTPAPTDAELPSLTVIVPAYNEGAQVLKTIESILKSDYPAHLLQIVSIDDGSRDDTWHWIQKGCDLDRSRVIGVRFTKNRGKREGLYEGFRRARGEIVVTIDSDSEILPDTLRNLVAPLVADPTVGGVGGNVRVLNERGLIARMLDVWYTFSFEFMRASESQVGTVSCCPGALSAYRRSLVDSFREEWVSQTFMGQPAAIGEDRAITNLVLRRGYKVLYQTNAIVLTEVPTRYVQLCKMLLRWARSDVRESIVMARFLFTNFREGSLIGTRVNFFWSLLQMVLASLMFLPAVLTPFLAPAAIPVIAASLAAGAILPGGLYLCLRRSAKAVFAVPYMALAVFGISWITPYSFLTPHKSSWLTRTLPATAQAPVVQLPQPSLSGRLPKESGQQLAA
ncbi:MAG: glycosyltransferase family 2 protein [Myxococcaceae bacterium]|nr:glycosyltransferase family 2 protein [Myxococcaceae bacterium]